MRSKFPGKGIVAIVVPTPELVVEKGIICWWLVVGCRLRVSASPLSFVFASYVVVNHRVCKETSPSPESESVLSMPARR